VRIIICADSHGNADILKKIIERNDKADIFVHLGDCESEVNVIRELYPTRDIRFVRGNNDYASTAPTSLVIDTPKGRVFCTHGHQYGVYTGVERLSYAAREADCQVACFGHTHARFSDYDDGLFVINPGSCTRPRDGKPPSYAFIDLTDAGIVVNIVDV
jgi:putative phosphoesterase